MYIYEYIYPIATFMVCSDENLFMPSIHLNLKIKQSRVAVAAAAAAATAPALAIGKVAAAHG